MTSDADPRSSLAYRLRYWNRRRSTLALRAAERMLTGRLAPHTTRALAIRPPSTAGGSVEVRTLHHPATVLHYAAPAGLPDWLVREAAVDATWSYAIRGARLSPDSGAVWLSDGTPIPELCGGAGRYAGSQDVRGLARARPRELIAGTWGVLPNHTYYHFLTEDLPALLGSLSFARQEIGVDAGVIAPRMRHRYVSDALDTLGIEVRSTDHAKVAVERLVGNGFASALVHPSSLDTLRTHFGLTEARGERWLYVSRAGFRRASASEHDLVTALKQRLPQLEVLQCHDLSLRAQVDAFSQAAVVIGPHGAGLSNLAFSPGTTRVVEIATQANCNDHFWRLSALRNQPYSLVWVDGSEATSSVADRIAEATS